MTIQTVFKRTERKYIITLNQRKQLLELISSQICSDKFGESTVRSLYFDTDDFRLIRNSIDKPVYKEKLRLRSYSTPKADSNVFLELKKKYKGVVYKRRETLKYSEAMNYLNTRSKPIDTQIMKEIDWTMNYYNGLKPKMFIAYDRTAFYSKEDSNLRITFDKNVRFRNYDLELGKGSYGNLILDSGLCIMEIKILNSMPLWLSNALTQLKIYPSSFSKYGTAYAITKDKNSIKNGGMNCA
ncbi:MAG: polyphosphate polymerase domain-containing protein [Ruminococcus bromii]|nr:polyphosphate polymerase domain-containing protein [Ruminococcus bromii]